METTFVAQTPSFQGSKLEKLSTLTFYIKVSALLPSLCLAFLFILGLVLGAFKKEIAPMPVLITAANVVFVIQCLLRLFQKNTASKWTGSYFTLSCIVEFVWLLSLVNLL